MDPYPSRGLIRSYNVFRAHSTGYAQNQMIDTANLNPQRIQSDPLYWAVRQIQTANNERAQTKRMNSQTKPRRIVGRKSAPAPSLPIHALAMQSPQPSQTTNSHDSLCNLFDDDETIEVSQNTASFYDERSVQTHKGQTLSTCNRAMTRGEQLMEINNTGITRRSRIEQHQSTSFGCQNEARSVSRQKRSADEITSWTIEASGSSDSDHVSSPTGSSLMDSKRRRISNINWC